MKKPMSRLKKIVLIGTGSLVLSVAAFIGFVGYLHTPEGRQLPIAQTLLTALGYKCPVTEVTAAQLTQLRKQAFALGPQSAQMAPQKWAFGFALGLTKPADVLAWAQRKQITCTERVKGYFYVECKDVAAELIGGRAERGSISELTFSFDENSKLISINLLRDGLDAAQASTILRELNGRLVGILGKPSRTSGDFSAENLQARYSGAGLDFKFKDYVASISAAHLPSGVSLYERYMTTVLD